MAQQRILCDLGGRAAEIAVLTRAFSAAAGGSGGAALIEGDAGIGKTRLLERLRDTVTATGGLFARGACYPYLRTPYAPIREAIRSLGEIELPLRTAKYEAFSATVQTLARCAGRAPLVVAIDDLQWADRATLELIDFIIDHIADHRILFVCTRRTESTEQPAGINAAVARIAQRGANCIHLGPLRFEEVQAIVDPDVLRALSHDTLARIVDRAEGNPLFIQEMLGELMSGGGAAGRVLPSSLRAQVSERLARLTSAERSVHAIASIIGAECDLDDVLATIDVPRVRRVSTVDKVLRSSHMLVAVNELRLAFRHSLLRDVVYESLSLRERRAGHYAIARRFEERLEPPASIALHYASAGDEGRAALWSERAGNEAMQVFAYADAAQFYRRACEIGASGDRGRLRESAANAFLMDGDIEAARVEYAQAADLFGVAQRPEDRLRMLAKLISVLSINVRYREGKAVARIAIREARALGNSDLTCNVFATAADNMRVAGHASRTRVLLHHAAACAPGAGAETLARFHDVSAKAAAGELCDRDAGLHLEASRKHAESTGNMELVIRVLSNAGDIAQRVGDYDRAIAIWRRILDIAREREFGWRIPFAELGLADLLLLRGDVAQAEPLVDDAIERGLVTEVLRFLAAGVGTRLGLARSRTDLIDVCAQPATLEAAFRVGESAHLSRVAGAFIELALARGDERRAGELVRAYAARRIGTTLAERVLPYVGRFGSPEDLNVAHCLLARLPAHRRLLHAYAAERSGDLQAARKLGHEAAEQFGALGLLAWQREAHVLAGTVAISAGARPQTLDTLTPREREICIEVARGDTNRDIAERLGISVKTVGHHLESIYARLGIEGRGRLVAYLNAERIPAA